jgi:hypothetical protein
MSKATILKLGAVAILGFAAAIPSATGPSVVSEATADSGIDLSGNYTLTGSGKDGSKYTGTASIKKIGGSMYDGKWVIGDNTFTGVGFLDGDTFSCGWSTHSKHTNVVAYLVKDDGLDGVWFENGGTKLGTEYLKPKGKAKKNLEGLYTIATGKNPDGSTYSGTCNIKELVKVGDEVYRFDWTIGSAKQEGIGIRNVDAGESDVMSVGFADKGAEYGALQYHVGKKGKVLNGTWVQVIKGDVTEGKEKMTKL